MSDLITTEAGKPWPRNGNGRLRRLPTEWRERRVRGRRSSLRGSQDPRSLADAKVTAAGLALSAVIVVAMVIDSGAVIVVASLATLAVAVASPLVGLIALAFTSVLPRPLEIPAPGLYFAMAGAILLGMVLRLPIDRPRIRLPIAAVVLLSAYFLYVTAHFAGGIIDGDGSGGAGVSSLFNNVATGVLAFLCASLVLRDKSPYPVLAALLLAAMLASGIAIAQALGADGLFGGLVGPSEAVDRMTGPFGDPNYFGAYLAAAITLAIGCAAAARSVRLRVLLVGLAGFISVALLLSLSRGGLVALAAGLTTIAFLRSVKTGLVAVVAIALLLLVAYPLFAETRYGTGSDLAGRGVLAQLENSDRVNVWLPAIDVFLTSPIFGVGYGTFSAVAESATSAHNWYLTVLAETGVFGFVLWALFIASIVVALSRRTTVARTVGLSVLATWLVSNLFLDVQNTYQGTGLVFIVLAAALTADWARQRTGATVAVDDSRPRGDARHHGRRRLARGL